MVPLHLHPARRRGRQALVPAAPRVNKANRAAFCARNAAVPALAPKTAAAPFAPIHGHRIPNQKRKAGGRRSCGAPPAFAAQFFRHDARNFQ